MVLKTQQWLNRTYKSKTGFGSVVEDGRTGWGTIGGLIRALQVELGIRQTASNFGAATQARFRARWPGGIKQSSATSNVYAIIQGALWCKGYAGEYGGITGKFTASVAASIKALKKDIGISAVSSTVDLEVMMALLSMKQFKLLSAYGAKNPIRVAQQVINGKYRAYTGIIPTDGLYGRDMNTALIQVLQALEGFSPQEATGNFGLGTRSRLRTVSGGTGAWVWLASVALACNGYSVTPTSSWSKALGTFVRSFQMAYALARTGRVDRTTWMSLLTSKGDPDRPCVACDTRFEVTDEFAKYLKADGYQIVGRYLSEPNQKNIAESDYFKALRTGELERIVRSGLKYFPIFQEYSTKLSYFTAASGARHAREAYQAARRLKVPATVIYFAVDYDATDPEVTSNILPYFRAVNANLAGGYRVGIYASRNICTRVEQAGYAVASFVSDMSTGFSGNLGFPIPNNWAFDQFHEITGYKGKWDLDRVAYSGRVAAANLVSTKSSRPSYSSMLLTDLIENFEDQFERMRKTYKMQSFGRDSALDKHGNEFTTAISTWHCTLNYLATSYLKGSVKWSAAAELYREHDAKLLKANKTMFQIVAALQKWIGNDRQNWVDSHGGEVDVAHLAVTTLGYVNANPSVPDKWTGWAGDLASALGPIQNLFNHNPRANLGKIATALVGQGGNYKNHTGLKGLKLPSNLPNNCNYSDLCSDADAIALASNLIAGNGDDPHLLSKTLRTYYSNPVKLASRFKNISNSIGARTKTEAKTKLFEEIVRNFNNFYVWALSSGGDQNPPSQIVIPSNDVKHAACNALAEFIF
ncbi:MAG: DUF1906 domain-containing protein [Winkia neuii]|uniref:DUF1906 domain-containing protein n=2 Tax=Winkia neuii TaxID=33007 RepID=A0A2I1IR13_9ACTO|nr:glycoside hydrolase domain-containing protein [Winkia neuii]MDK8098599.1 DUF1906 domain-containing protein [Winkia neuii]MDU3134201.1 DUF1906 domain-containing protein [Winkia neuii]OFK02229.1 peptidoglycan-binding protein [Actinomyces sp. HMSC072A03]PKY73545.1 DUF1906 domain-containing protein [Winkia neuii]